MQYKKFVLKVEICTEASRNSSSLLLDCLHASGGGLTISQHPDDDDDDDNDDDNDDDDSLNLLRQIRTEGSLLPRTRQGDPKAHHNLFFLSLFQKKVKLTGLCKSRRYSCFSWAEGSFCWAP